MTRQEAEEAIAAGKKVTHKSFQATEFIHNKEGRLCDELGLPLNTTGEFWYWHSGNAWEEGWEIFKEE